MAGVLNSNGKIEFGGCVHLQIRNLWPCVEFILALQSFYFNESINKMVENV